MPDFYPIDEREEYVHSPPITTVTQPSYDSDKQAYSGIVTSGVNNGQPLLVSHNSTNAHPMQAWSVPELTHTPTMNPTTLPPTAVTAGTAPLPSKTSHLQRSDTRVTLTPAEDHDGETRSTKTLSLSGLSAHSSQFHGHTAAGSRPVSRYGGASYGLVR